MVSTKFGKYVRFDRRERTVCVPVTSLSSCDLMSMVIVTFSYGVTLAPGTLMAYAV